MSRSIKRVISLLLTLCMVLGFGAVAGAETSDRVRTQIEGLGLMQGYENGEFGAEDELTRAQMAMIVARLLQLENVSVGGDPFTDVAEDHWAYGVITTLYDMEIINGMGDGTFMPERSVNYFEAVKMLVAVLGYEQFAEDQGGYPGGYNMQAGKMGILKDVTAKEGTITRGEVAQLLYNSLRIRPIGGNFMQNYLNADYTLYDILTDNKDLVRITGVLKETSTASLDATEPALRAGYVIVGSNRLETDAFMDEYLGCELTVFATVDEDGRPKEIRRFSVTNDTTVTTVASDDVVWDGNTAIITTEDGDEEELDVSGTAKILYNGRLGSFSDIYYGSYTFIDNNDDTVADVLRIDEAQSFIVDKVNAAKATVYFKNNATLNGRRAVVLDVTDEDKAITVLDGEGNVIKVEDIKSGDGITVFSSTDTNYVKAVISTQNIAGKITQISSEGIHIDGEAYKVALKPNGSANFTPEVNAEGNYVLDCFGNVIGSAGAVTGQYLYAYVIDAGAGTGLDKTLSLRTITGTEPVKEVTTTAGVDNITYYFQNESVKIYECAESVTVYNRKNSASPVGNRVKAASLNPTQFTRSMIAFRLNGDGKINELYMYDTRDASFLPHQFNAKAMTFGGAGINRGYATDEATKFICIPDLISNPNPSLSDYSVQLSYADAAEGVKVFGTVFIPSLDYADPDSEPVDIVLIRDNMNAASAPVPSASADICIVGSVKKAVSTLADDAGGMVYELELLNGESVVKVATGTSGEAYNVAATLRKGDLIRYVKDGFGRIAGVKKLYSVQGLADNFSNNINIQGTSFRGQYGFIYDAILDSFDAEMNDYIDKVYLSFAEDGNLDDFRLDSYLRAAKEDAPPVYLYNRKNGWITPGSLEDITASAYAGSDASKAFVLTESSDISAIVIIED